MELSTTIGSRNSFELASTVFSNEDVPPGETLRVDDDNGLCIGEIERAFLNEVIHLRTREILEKIKDRCQDHLGRLAAGVYLTGGVSLMKGIDGVARDVFGIKVTRAGSAQVSGVTAMFENPQYSTPIGLIRYAQILDSEKPFLSPLARLGRRMADLLSCWTF